MTQRLIIIRGNSGSGKSTIAKRLQVEMGRGTMLIPQDVIRRDILKVLDEPGNASVDLIYEMAMFGRKKSYDVIVEGILSNDKYEDMLKKLINDFEGETYVYYLDIPFKETVRRHATKSKASEFGEKEMREWWKDKDYLGVEGETILSSDLSEDELVSAIMLKLAV